MRIGLLVTISDLPAIFAFSTGMCSGHSALARRRSSSFMASSYDDPGSECYNAGMAGGFELMHSLLRSDAPSLRDGLPEDLPDVDAITAISYRDAPERGAEALRCTTETEALDRLAREARRGSASWAHLIVAHGARVVRLALTGSPLLKSALVDLMATCALWLTQIEKRSADQLRAE